MTFVAGTPRASGTYSLGESLHIKYSRIIINYSCVYIPATFSFSVSCFASISDPQNINNANSAEFSRQSQIWGFPITLSLFVTNSASILTNAEDFFAALFVMCRLAKCPRYLLGGGRKAISGFVREWCQFKILHSNLKMVFLPLKCWNRLRVMNLTDIFGEYCSCANDIRF